jgi:hypothetical protein
MSNSEEDFLDLDSRSLYDKVMNEQRQPVEYIQKQNYPMQQNRGGSNGGVMSTVVWCCVFLLLLAVVLYLTVFRYVLVGDAINKGESLTSIALLSPEIGNAIRMAMI